MPVFNFLNELPPVGSEVKLIKLLVIEKGDVCRFEVNLIKEKIFICEGKVSINLGSSKEIFGKNEFISFERYSIRYLEIIAIEKSILIRVAGNWNSKHGNCGVFELDTSCTPKNIGDATEYERNTQFDNHFHDCDEFWILYEGEGEVVTEEKRFQVSGGDCVYTKAGDHHDFPIVNKTIKGVWFETSYIGKMREGHLWNHAHNKAESENEL